MLKRNSALIATLSFVALAGCEQQDAPVERLQKAVSPITDVAHTPVERQSIGNCWLYAEASWGATMKLAAISAGNPGGGGEGDTCAHNVCDEGVKLEASCSSCATAICAADEYCCDTEWDSVCTGAVAEICGADACNAVDDTPEVEVEPLDVSQSYWTYWHWFDQITGRMWGNEISTGGNTWTSHAIIRDRGVMKELDFVPEDSDGEMSNRQS